MAIAMDELGGSKSAPLRAPRSCRPIEVIGSPEAGARRSFERDQQIFSEGDPSEHFYEVVSGTVRTYKLLGDGRRQIDAFHLPGDLFGVETGLFHRFSAEAIQQVTIRAFRRSDFEALQSRDAILAGRVFDAMARALERAQDHMLLLGRKCAREKIASFLLGFMARVSQGKTVELPMSRTDIADHLGLTIETVSRTLTQFQREKIIELPANRRVILLKNTCALRHLEAGDIEHQAHPHAVRLGAQPSLSRH